jgi:hypothetical protein
MSAARHRYELWSRGRILASYKTLGPALLGALRHARKFERAMYVHKAGKNSGSCIASVKPNESTPAW